MHMCMHAYTHTHIHAMPCRAAPLAMPYIPYLITRHTIHYISFHNPLTQCLLRRTRTGMSRSVAPLDSLGHSAGCIAVTTVLVPTKVISYRIKESRSYWGTKMTESRRAGAIGKRMTTYPQVACDRPAETEFSRFAALCAFSGFQVPTKNQREPGRYTRTCAVAPAKATAVGVSSRQVELVFPCMDHVSKSSLNPKP